VGGVVGAREEGSDKWEMCPHIAMRINDLLSVHMNES